MKTLTSLTEARDIYNRLTTRQTVAGEVERVILKDPGGEVEIAHSALVALNLDNLFSGRWQGDAVEAVLVRALNAAISAPDADLDTPSLPFAVSFGALGTVRLCARAGDARVVVHAA